jgi:hypothetical protein
VQEDVNLSSILEYYIWDKKERVNNNHFDRLAWEMKGHKKVMDT